MAKQVVVTSAQHAAARTIVKRDAAKGKTTRPAILAIARAKGAEPVRHTAKLAG